MYRQRDTLDARRIQILSPGSAFSEYISAVLPDLGEENIRSRTLREIVEDILGKKVESPLKQAEKLLLDPAGETAHATPCAYKSGTAFLQRTAQVRRVVLPPLARQFRQRLAGRQAAHPPRGTAAHVQG